METGRLTALARAATGGDPCTLGELLAELEPLVVRPRPAGLRVRRFLVPAVALALAALVGAGLLLRDGSGSAPPVERSLPALPPGGPQALAPAPSLGMVIAVSLDEAIAQADVVFVGSVSAIGG